MKVPADFYHHAEVYVRERDPGIPQRPWTCDDCGERIEFAQPAVLASRKRSAFWTAKFHPSCYEMGAPWRHEMADAARGGGTAEGFRAAQSAYQQAQEHFRAGAGMVAR